MSRTAQALTTAVLCAACFGGGLWWASPTGVPAPAEVSPAITPATDAPWLAALDAARATAQAGTLRAEALEVLNTSDSDVALAEAILLLGWVGHPADLELLRSFARSGEPSLARPGLEALGRLGTVPAVDELIVLLDRRDIDRDAVVLGLGNSGHPRALQALEARLTDRELGYAAAWGLSRYGGADAAAALIRGLRTADANLAAPIASALASMSDELPEASDALHALLAGPRTPRRMAALQALAEAGDPLVYDLLVEDLTTGPSSGRAQAAHALGQLGDPRAVPLLLRAARDGHSDVRYPAMGALTALDLPEADEALLDLVESAPAPVAARAVGALPRVDSERTLSLLLWAATNRPTEVRRAVHQRLFSAPWPAGSAPEEVLALARAELGSAQWGGWGNDPVGVLLTHGTAEDLALVREALTRGNPQARSAAVWSLQQLATPFADELLQMLADDVDPGVRQAALNVMMQRGQEALVEEKLLASLADGAGPMHYGYTEQLLVRIATPRATQAVLDRIEDGTQREWSAAISAVANSGSRAQVEQLMSMAERTDNPQLKRQILQSLVYSETADLEVVVDQALAEGDPMLEATATQALARMGTPDSKQKLLGLAESESPQTRQAALSALAQGGGPEAEQALIAALDDPEVAWAAVGGLQQVGTETARAALLDAAQNAEDPSVRSSVLHQLAWTHGVDSAGVLAEALTDDADEVRGSAITALENLGTTQAAETLADVLDDPEATEGDVMRAAQALSRMGGTVAEQHADAIEDLMPDPGLVDTGFAGDPIHFEF